MRKNYTHLAAILRRVSFSMTLAALIILTVLSPPDAAAQPIPSIDATSKVDVFIGTANDGNTYPGATLPFGMVNLSPHTDAQQWQGTYVFGDKTTLGFTHNQVSGIGYGELGNFLVMPVRNALNVVGHGYRSQRTTETAYPGYYASQLTAPNALAELTVTPRTGRHRYTFAAGNAGDTLRLVFNTAYAMKPQTVVRAFAFLSDSGRTVRGYGGYDGGFGSNPGSYTAYFSARVSPKPASFAAWDTGVRYGDSSSAAGFNQACGVVINYVSTGAPLTVEVTAAISYRDQPTANTYVSQALQEAVPFDSVAARARQTWRDLLGKVQVSGGTAEQQKIFYTSLYHTFVSPNDITGDTPPGFLATGAAYTNYFAIWDTYRTVHPFFTLLVPTKQRDMLNALLDIADNRGWLPDGHTGSAVTVMQGGTNADVLFADAAVKNLAGVDYNRAFTYLLKNATVPSPQGAGMSASFGRYGEYLSNGWLSYNNQWASVSKTLEYAYNDYSVWALGNSLGRASEAQAALTRSLQVFTLFDTTTGFFRPKNSNGTWLPGFSPTATLPENGWTYELHFYEGSAWQYLGYVPHAFPVFITKLGGDAAFINKWNTLFQNRAVRGYYTHGNEPGFLSAYQYIYAGRADLAQYWARTIMKELYTSAPSGIPGNDDSGAMSSWYVCSALGLFPNAGQDWYFLGSPLFTAATLTLENGAVIQINAPAASDSNLYVKTIKLNGTTLNRAWVRHSEIASGAVIDFEMVATPQPLMNTERPPSPFTTLNNASEPPETPRPARTFSLSQNYPNPFNPETIINYDLGITDNVSLKVFDVLGREVAVLVNERKPAGNYSVRFNAAGLSSGVYFYQLRAGAFIETRKMTVVK